MHDTHRNIIIDSSFNNIQNSNITIKVPKYKIPNKLTTNLGEAPKFKGRIRETKELIKSLNKHKAVVVHGIGGIGKSSFVSAYLNTHKNEFKYYGFINWIDDIKLNFFNSLQVNMKLEDYGDIDKNFDEAMKKLRDLDGQKLLIIDRIEEKEINYSEEEKSIRDILTLIDNDYKIIFISRFKIKNLNPYPLNSLDKEDAKDIFLTYYKTTEIEKVYEILEYLDYHALFVKLVAETLEVTNFSIETIIQKFDKGELSKIEFIDEYTMDTTSFNKNLKKLFDMQKINEDGLLLLKQFSALPSIGVELTFLENILDKDELLKNRLDVLVTHGWLILDKKNYKLHQIIKEYILLEKQPLYVEIETIFEYFFKLIENSADINVATSNRENLIFFDSLHKVVKKYEYFIIAQFYMNLGNIYRYLGIYKKALFFGKLSIKVLNSIIDETSINEKIFKNLLIHKAIFYNNLSQTYYLLGTYKRVFILDKKVLTLRKQILGENHISTIQSYHNLAQLNFSCGNIEEAKNIFEKAIILIDKLKQIENRHMYINEKTTLYSNYAIFLSKTQPKNKSAIIFAQKAVGIYTNEYEKVDSTLATFYFHLATIYEDFGKGIKAKRLYEIALKIKIDTFGEEHNDVATAYMGLAFFYLKLNNKDCSKSIKYMHKALEIYKRIYMTEKHSDIALCYDNLGSMYNRCKDYINSNKFSLKALTLHVELLGEEHYRTIQTYLNVAISFYMLEKYIEALTNVTKIIELQSTCLDKFDSEIIISLLGIISSNDKIGESLIGEIGKIINRIKI